MALFKCKACGGDIIPNEDKYTGKCEYCGTKQTLPKDKDEKISQILNRANDFRLNCDFDRAIFEYEKVLELDETEPEAHWGIFLSRYGVEYVKDTMSLAYKPTLHRISSTSVFDDVDYQATLKYASLVAGEQYKKDATLIESVMKELLLLSANQDPYDIFLSYKELDDVTRQRTDDSYLAHDLYNELTAQGYKVFFAPKSLIGAGLYEPKIYSAIISAKVMIVLGTRPQYLEGVWVKNEWSRFAEAIEHGENKVLIPVFKNMEAGQLPNRLAKYQAYDMSSMTFLDSVKQVISEAVKKQSNVNFDKNASAEDAYLERGYLALEDKNFSQAEAFFENVLNLNPHNSQAYFGKLMVEMRISKQNQILTAPRYLKEYANFEKAVRFADQQLKTTLLQYEEKVKNILDEQERIKQENLRIAEEKRREEDAKKATIKKEFVNKIKKASTVSATFINQNWHAVGLKANGTVVATGFNWLGRCNVKKWKNIIAVSVGSSHTVGLKSDGTVVAVGSNFYGQCNVSNWHDIVAISAGYEHTIGLKADGTVVAVGRNHRGQCNVNNWTGIVAISAGLRHTIGLKSDGTVIATKYLDDMRYYNGQCSVESWRDIVAISAGSNHTVGLKSDGTVVSTSYTGFKQYYSGQCDILGWTDIVAVSAGIHHTVGLKSDGTVVTTKFIKSEYGRDEGQYDVSGWTDIVAISAGCRHTLGLKSDGTIVATGKLGVSQGNMDNWKLFNNFNTLDEEFSLMK